MVELEDTPNENRYNVGSNPTEAAMIKMLCPNCHKNIPGISKSGKTYFDCFHCGHYGHIVKKTGRVKYEVDTIPYIDWTKWGKQSQ